MKTINVESIVELITVGNGSINSFALANLIGVKHGDFTKKLASRLLKIKRDDLGTMEEIHVQLTGATGVEAVQVEYTSGNNAISTRIEYEMTEHVAYKMAMSYSDDLSDMIYDAYVMYRETLQEIAAGCANPQLKALMILDSDYIAKRKNNIKGAQPRFIKKVYETVSNPVDAYEHILDVYDNLSWDPITREKFYDDLERKTREIQKEYRMTSEDFDEFHYNQFVIVLSSIYKRQRAKARRNRTDNAKKASNEHSRAEVNKGKVFKAIELYTNQKNRADHLQVENKDLKAHNEFVFDRAFNIH